MSDTKPDIAAIKARVEKATPGPWVVGQHTNIGKIRSINRLTKNGKKLVVAETTDMYHHEQDGVVNAEFIAHARTDIPALLEALEAAEGKINWLERGAPAAYLAAQNEKVRADVADREVGRLRVALGQYARHEHGCALQQAGPDRMCDCGLNVALSDRDPAKDG